MIPKMVRAWASPCLTQFGKPWLAKTCQGGKTAGWNRTSYALMSAFLVTILLILYIWQPLARDYVALFNPDYPLWMQIDWLLVGIFAFMSLMIMAGADLRHDAQVAFVGLVGGLVIESWGTQTYCGRITRTSARRCGSSPPGPSPAWRSTAWRAWRIACCQPRRARRTGGCTRRALGFSC